MATAHDPEMRSELVINRTFDAPREKVFKAWTDCDRLMRWWGPRGFTAPACHMDFHVGGKYLSSMRSPEGREYWSTGRYREIVAPKRLVMTDSFADEQGNVVSASYYGMSGDWPLEMQITVDFENDHGKTRLTLRHSGIEKIRVQDIDDMRHGWNESFDKLEESLKHA